MKKKLLLRFLVLLTFFLQILFVNTCFCTNFFESPPWSVAISGGASTKMDWHPNGKYLAIPTGDSTATLKVLLFDGSTLTTTNVATVGSSYCSAAAWHPNGMYLAAGGNSAYSAGNAFRLFRFNGTQLSSTGQDRTFGSDQYSVITEVRWHPSGKYVVYCGYRPTVTNTEIQLYRFTDGVLSANLIPAGTSSTTPSPGIDTWMLSWSPDGNYLAMGNDGTLNTGHKQIEVYDFNPEATNPLTIRPENKKDYGSSYAFCVTWRPDGKYLAIASYAPTDTYQIQIYGFNNKQLTSLPVVEAKYQNSNTQWACRSADWSPDGKYLAIGGEAPTAPNQQINIYEFNDLSPTPTLKLLPNGIDFTGITNCYGVRWSKDGTYLAASKYNTALNIYKRFGSVDGIRNNVYAQNNWPFIGNNNQTAGYATLTNAGGAVGDVFFANGLTLGRSQTLDLDTTLPIYGPITLEYSSILNLRNNIHFGDSVSLTSSFANISGNGYTLFLDGNLTTTINTVIHISSNTAIDGQNHSLTLGPWSQIMVDQNATLTLRNLILKNTINSPGFPCLTCTTTLSKIALDNIEFAPVNDFYFRRGQLYIHNDVVFTGTSQFVYQSAQQSYIAPNAIFSFEPNTTFFYDTASTYSTFTRLATGALNYNIPNNQLIALQDATSTLYLNGCTLQVSATGLQLTKGQVFFDNNVTLKNNTTPVLTVASTPITADFGSGAQDAAWNPDGKTLAVSGNTTNASTGGVTLYRWNGTSLTTISTLTIGRETFGISWSPDGKYLAVTAYYTTYTYKDLLIYQWDGANLKLLASSGFNNFSNSVSWSPDGNFLTCVGNNLSADVVVFQWNGTSLINLGSAAIKDHGSSALSASWSPDGRFLAIGGNNGSADLTVYQWNGLALTDLGAGAKKDVGTAAYDVNWSPDGRYLAVANSASTLYIYEWQNPTLTLVLSSAIVGSAYSASWSPDGKFFAVRTGTSGITFYSWNGAALTQVATASPGGGTIAAKWNPSGDSYATAGSNGTSDVSVYKITYTPQTLTPSNDRGLIFGNASLGTRYNVSTNLLNNAKVTTYGKVLQNKA